ncbi:MAG: epimerase [Mesorhizobium sp.]|nr:MAG: epimerase [Mesorhizobium sp.]
MHLGIIGATGNIGQRVLAEAVSRGHKITAFTRDASRFPEDPGDVVWKTVDIFNVDDLSSGMAGLDVLVSTYQPGNAARDFNDTVARSIEDPTVYATAAQALLRGMENHLRLRLIVVGGAGSLEVKPGLTRADSPDDLRESMKLLGLPEAYAEAVRGHRDALNVLRLSNRLWTYFSPAEEIYPGERTGRFRLGGDQPILDENGRSRISIEDAAIAIVDEAELPRHVQRRFTIGY